MKKQRLFCLIVLCLLLLNGCVSFLPERFSSTAFSEEGLHSPVAGEENADTVEAQLYFRFLDEPFLAPESRTLIVRKDESVEKAIVSALLAGPSAASPQMRRLFSDDVTVESTLAQEDLLFVTLSENVTQPLGDEPALWRQDESWRREVALRRRLAMQSLAATLIESCGYQSVQILLDKRADTTGSMRLPMSYYEPGAQGLAPVLRWDDSLLLTPEHTAFRILESYRQKDWERVLYYVAAGGGSQRPSQSSAVMMMDQWLTLYDFELGSVTVSPGGDQAIIGCQAHLARTPGDQQTLPAHSLRLTREGGLWKIQWSELEKLLNHW